MRSAIALFLLSTLAAPATGHADAIRSPPACPPGARGISSHAGAWCAPWPCASDAECDGAACRPWRVCTRAAMVPPGGRGSSGLPPTRMELVVGTCEPARACTGTEEPPPSVAPTFEPGPPTCTEASFCVHAPLPLLPPRPVQRVGSAPVAIPSSPLAPPPPPPLPPSPPDTARGCACGVAPTRAALAPIALVIVVTSLLLSRRRR